MKRSEVEVTVSLRQVLEAPYCCAWEAMCLKYGINEWAINEGLADYDDTIQISLEDAENWGIVEK